MQAMLTGRPCRHTSSFPFNEPIPASLPAFWLRCAEEKQARGPEVAAAPPACARACGRAHAEGGGCRGGQSHPLACQGGQHRALGRPSHPWVSAVHACYRLCRRCQALEAHPSALSHEPSRVCKNTEIWKICMLLDEEHPRFLLARPSQDSAHALPALS